MKTRGYNKTLNDLIVAIPEKVLFQQLGDAGDEVVLLNIESGGYYGLNEVGARIWCLIQEGRSIGEIIKALVKEYEVSEESLRADVRQFLDDLHSRELIEIRD
jgi:hypothetical protein